MKFLNALNKIEGIGSQKMNLLMNYFPTPESAWNASISELVKSGLKESLAEKIVQKRNEINPEKEWETLQKEAVSIISINDKTYPPLLREIHNPPYILYVKGDVSLLNSNMISVVGSRRFTEYGSRVASSFGRDLANAGITVVSGLALGIDAIAHKGSLEVRGKTIAVLGNSLDEKSIHPRTNFELSKEIIENNGLLLSEYPIPTQPSVGTFPARNRLMAGMSLGTVVIEAALDSGSLITANLALEFNREVFAVPGPIFYPQSQGPHMLIKNGAKIATSIADILEEINVVEGYSGEQKSLYAANSAEEEKLLSILSQEPLHIDTIAKLTKLNTSLTSSTLAILEINGAVKNIGGQNYIKT